MKKLFSISIMMTLMMSSLLISCSPDDPTGGVEKPNNVVTNLTTDVSPFSLTLNGAINNYSVAEVSRGQYGFLYVVSNEMDEFTAKNLFEEYLANGSATGCKKRYAVNLLTGNAFSVNIIDLTPNSKVFYCALFETEKGDVFIGEVQSVISSEFTPSVKATNVLAARLLDCKLKVDIDFSGATNKECLCGIYYSDSEETLLAGGIQQQYKGPWKQEGFEINISQIKANTTYYVRPYVYYKAEKKYYYGDIIEFTTLNPDDFAVDMGLSVKWASCDLGASQPLEIGWAFQYLTTNPVPLTLYSYNDYMSYEDYNRIVSENNSATEHDAATYYLGGKWRMPTLAEVEELIANMVMEVKTPNNFEDIENEHIVIWSKAKQGAHIKFNHFAVLTSTENLAVVRTLYRWTATADPEVAYGSYSMMPNMYYFDEYDYKVYTSYSTPMMECLIRPVCDY